MVVEAVKIAETTLTTSGAGGGGLENESKPYEGGVCVPVLLNTGPGIQAKVYKQSVLYE